MNSENNSGNDVQSVNSENRVISQPQAKPVSIFKRFIALLIDGAIINSVTIVFSLGSTARFAAVYMVVHFVYSGYFYSKRQATPGKMVFDLEVVSDQGKTLSFIEGGLRDGLGRFISGLILGLGYMVALFRDDKKALHDLIFRTQVRSK